MIDSNMWKAASRLCSINDDKGNQYLKLTYRLQLFLVKTLNDLNMRLCFKETEGICGLNQKKCRGLQTSFIYVGQRVQYKWLISSKKIEAKEVYNNQCCHHIAFLPNESSNYWCTVVDQYNFKSRVKSMQKKRAVTSLYNFPFKKLYLPPNTCSSG